MAYGKSKPKVKNMHSGKHKTRVKKKAAGAKSAGLKGKQNKLPAFLKNKIKKAKKK